MNTKLWVVVVVGLLAVPLTLQAAVFKSGETVTLDEASSDDAFVSGSSVTIKKAVAGDLFAAGQSVSVESDANEDVYAAGEIVRITAPVKQDILAAGRLVSIDTSTVDDIMATGNTVEISPDTKIQGNIYAAGQTIDIGGTINGSVYATGQTVRLKSGTVVKGDVHTYGPQPIVEDNVTIEGKRLHTDQPKHEDQAQSARSRTLGWLYNIVSWFIFSLVMLYVLPLFSQTVVTNSLRSSGYSLIIGVLWALVCIPAVVLLCVTVIGIPLGVSVLLLSLLFGVITMAYIPMITGYWLMNRLSSAPAAIMTWQHVLLGVVVMQILWLIPVIGALITIILFILALGALLMALWRNLRGETLDTPITSA